RFWVAVTIPDLVIVSCCKNSVAVRRFTFPTNSWILLPDLSSTSSRLHAAPGSTAGTFSSTSGGNQSVSPGRGAGLAEAAAELFSRESAFGCSEEVRTSEGEL